MLKIVRIYKRNIYGVMGTLVFHILLVSVFLLAEVRLKREMTEDAILIDFPDEMLLEDIEKPEQESFQQYTDAQMSNIPASRQTNRPANRSTSASDKFFDENYQQEIEAAKRLVNDVNQQLAKEIVDINHIRMPEQTTEGMDRDSIKNIVYTGESNIEYHLENRYHIRLPIPVYLARGGGSVTVDIGVNRDGKVVSARPRRTPSISDEQIYLYAQTAAQRTIFNQDLSAPALQNGTIKYLFIPQ